MKKQIGIVNQFEPIVQDLYKSINDLNLNKMKTDSEKLHDYRNEVITHLQKFTGCPSYQICAEMADEYSVEIDFGFMATRPAKDTADKICCKAFVS